jgi:hypothetical protein
MPFSAVPALHMQWVDEDEEADKEDFDVSNLQNMSNFDLGGAGAAHHCARLHRCHLDQQPCC